VLGGVQRLDAAARAEVEDAARRPPYGQPRQRRGRAAGAEDHVGVAGGVGEGGAGVGDDPPVEAALPRVRPHLDAGAHLTGLGPHPAVGERRLGQRGPRAAFRHGPPQQEQPHQGGQRPVALPALLPRGAKRGRGLAPRERGVRGRAEHLQEPVGGEVGLAQRLAQPRRAGAGDREVPQARKARDGREVGVETGIEISVAHGAI
jgi:hypothetical protein